MAQLLHQYSYVFNQREKYVARTELVQHDLFMVPDTQLIRQALYRVRSEKKAEIDWQVSKLAYPEMIESTYEA